MALTKQDLRNRLRRLDELARLLSIEEGRFKDCDCTLDVQLHFTNRQEYRAALHDAIRGLSRARIALAAVVHRGQ
jgi:hypothetical protein